MARRTIWLLAACAALALVPAGAQNAQDLQQLRGQIDSLKQDLAQSETTRDSTSEALQKAEHGISEANRTLEQLLQRQRQLSRSAHDLEAAIAGKRSEVALRAAQVGKLYRQLYQAGSPPAWQSLLNAQSPDDIGRGQVYALYWARAQQRVLNGLRSDTEQLKVLLGHAQDQQQELAQVAMAQKQQQHILLAEKQARQAALLSLSQRIANQKQRIGKLEKDERRLTQLVNRLAELSRQREEQRSKHAEHVAAAPKAPEPKAVEPVPVGSSFAALKGHLHLPMHGEMGNRFGQARAEGGAWKGIFIRAEPGKPVLAIAAGEVVFADWLRGFGNLIIVDHGGGYLSLYGYNETLLKQVGDSVALGERIAVSGNSGGQSESGLYFEIRFQGRPVDPMAWVS